MSFFSTDIIYGCNQIQCFQIIFVPQIYGNVIALDDFQNAVQFVAFDPVVEVIAESLEVFLLIYDLIRTVAQKTGKFCHGEIRTGPDIDLALNNRI